MRAAVGSLGRAGHRRIELDSCIASLGRTSCRRGVGRYLLLGELTFALALPSPIISFLQAILFFLFAGTSHFSLTESEYYSLRKEI